MKNKLLKFLYTIVLFFITTFCSVKNFFALNSCKDNFNSSFNIPPSINVSKHFEDSDDEISLPNSRNTSKVSNKSNFGEDDESNVTPTTNNNTQFSLRVSPLLPMVNSTPLNESTHKKLKRNCFNNLPDISPTNPPHSRNSSVTENTSSGFCKKLDFSDQEE